MFDHRWLPPSEVVRLLPDRRLKVPGPRRRRAEQTPSDSTARPRDNAR